MYVFLHVCMCYYNAVRKVSARRDLVDAVDRLEARVRARVLYLLEEVVGGGVRLDSLLLRRFTPGMRRSLTRLTHCAHRIIYVVGPPSI